MISLTKHNELKGYKSLDAYPEVAHFVTTRHGGISTGAYGSFNCSPYTNDSCVNVNRNQNWLFQCMNHQIKELFIPEQSHGCASLIINESFFKESLERRRLLQMIRAKCSARCKLLHLRLASRTFESCCPSHDWQYASPFPSIRHERQPQRVVFCRTAIQEHNPLSWHKRNIPAHSLSKHPFLAEVAVSFPMIL